MIFLGELHHVKRLSFSTLDQSSYLQKGKVADSWKLHLTHTYFLTDAPLMRRSVDVMKNYKQQLSQSFVCSTY